MTIYVEGFCKDSIIHDTLRQLFMDCGKVNSQDNLLFFL